MQRTFDSVATLRYRIGRRVEQFANGVIDNAFKKYMNNGSHVR